MESGGEKTLHPQRVPDAEYAVADERKFTEYLLNEAHPVGRAKARFFRQIGYAIENWQELRDLFLTQLPFLEAHFSKSNDYGGDNYEVRFVVNDQEGTPVEVRTFWEVHPTTGTRLLTAYKLDSS